MTLPPTIELHARIALRRAFYVENGLDPGEWATAEEAFMRWALGRGAQAGARGSRWWSAVNERLIDDGLRASLGEETTPATQAWRAFLRAPSPRRWHEAHLRSILDAAAANTHLRALEAPAERRLIDACLARLEAFSQLLGWVPPSTGARLVRGVLRQSTLYPRVYPAPPARRRVRVADALIRWAR